MLKSERDLNAQEKEMTEAQKAELFDVFFSDDLTEIFWDGAKIGLGGCAYKPTLKKIVLPNVEVVQKDAFIDCEKLECASIPKLRVLGADSFRGCKSLKSIELNSLETIGRGAFTKCKELEEVCLESVELVGQSSFKKCEKLKKATFRNATYVGSQAFMNCKQLESVSLPKARFIDSRAFACCESLKEIDLPSAITIGEEAFTGCRRLEKVVLGSETGVEFLGEDVFRVTERLFGFSHDEFNPEGLLGEVYVPDELVEFYKLSEAFTINPLVVRPMSEIS